MSMFGLRKMGQAQKYRDEADDGSGKGGGGGGAIDVQATLSNPEIQKAIQDKIDAEVAGLKKKNAEVIADQKKLKETLSQFDGLDVEKMKNLQKQMEANQELTLLAEGKTEEVIARRVELLKKDYDSQITAREEKLKEQAKSLKEKDESLRKLVVDGKIRETFISLDFEPTAMDDVLRNAREVFIMGDDGKVVPRDAGGNMLFGKDGTTPLDAKAWLELQAEKKPYLRRASKGSGASNASGYRAGGDISKMSSTGKIAEGLKKLGM